MNEITQRERNSRCLKFPIHNNIRSEIFIANVHKFKTVQLHIGGWIFIDEEYTNTKINHVFKQSSRKIKARIENLAKTNSLIKKESIVIFETGDMETGKKARRNYQYLNVDITIFMKLHSYNKREIKCLTKPLIKDIIENDMESPEVFNFIRKTTGMKQYGE